MMLGKITSTQFPVSHIRALLVMEYTPALTITINETKVGSNGYCLAWCSECSDGINDTRDDCDMWVVNHAKRKHGWSD